MSRGKTKMTLRIAKCGMLLALILVACGGDGSSNLMNADVDENVLRDSRDGQTYKTVQIGSQIWMAENLNYKTEGSYCYEDDASNCKIYGRLYTWETAMTVCPEGFHLPNRAEFDTLFQAVGGKKNASTQLKATSLWMEHDGESGNGTDAYGFAALPGGERGRAGKYYSLGYDAMFWNSSEDNEYLNAQFPGVFAGYMILMNKYSNASQGDFYKEYAYSVRCVKD